MTKIRSAIELPHALDDLGGGGERVGKKRRRSGGRTTRKARRRDDEMPTEADFDEKGDDDMTAEFDLDNLGDDEDGEAPSEIDRDNLGASELDLDAIGDDGDLVARCVAGEVGAWEQLYNQCHAPLLLSIRCFLGQAVPDRNLIDELAARVWYALIENDGKLLARFDKQRGARLGTFLRHVARDVTARHFRTEIRRRRRERVAGRRHETKRRATGEVEAAMAEFVDTLTPAEQAFLEQHLLGGDGADGSGRDLSEANFWQITSRIRRKFHRFFHAEEENAADATTDWDGENRLDGNGPQAEAPAEEDSGAKNLGAVRRRPR